MKKIIVLIAALFVIVSGLYAQNKRGKMDSTQQTTYTCPMHPEVVANKPGKCPKCGMTLVKKKSPAGAKPKKDSTGMKMK